MKKSNINEFEPFIKKEFKLQFNRWCFALHRMNPITNKVEKVLYLSYALARQDLRWFQDTSIEVQKEYFRREPDDALEPL